MDSSQSWGYEDINSRVLNSCWLFFLSQDVLFNSSTFWTMLMNVVVVHFLNADVNGLKMDGSEDFFISSVSSEISPLFPFFYPRERERKCSLGASPTDPILVQQCFHHNRSRDWVRTKQRGADLISKSLSCNQTTQKVTVFLSQPPDGLLGSLRRPPIASPRERTSALELLDHALIFISSRYC